MIAARSGVGIDLDALRMQVKDNLPRVVVSSLGSRLFNSLLDVLSGQKEPGDFWRELNDLGTAPEVGPYRQYLLAPWKARRNEWGTIPRW
jgi:hypothetical protein